jgi:transcriptional regulator with AAA-type ATPase domain
MKDDAPRRSFRWQALFQRVSEALFVLDRRRRLLFVNHGFERLTGLGIDRARGLVCRAPRPVGPEGSAEELISHILTPPPEVLQGAFARSRRLYHDRTGRHDPPAPPAWWDVEFLPFRQGGDKEGHLIVGRVVPLPAGASPVALLVPERLVDLRQRTAARFSLDLVASGHPAMRRLEQQVRLASEVRTPLWLVGEAGTGKQTLARLVHARGPRREQAFCTLDCGRLPPASVAALLLGEASSPLRAGIGAIYLREPGRLPRDLQLRLCERLAVEEPDAPRLMAGSRSAPSELVRGGAVLDELAGLLSPLLLDVPPLRERPNDLPRLVESLLARLNEAGGKRVSGVSPAASEVLRGHDWPGNIAELFGVLRAARERAADERIDAGDLPTALRLPRGAPRPVTGPAADLPLPELLELVERRVITLALARARGNQSRAAELLGIHRPRLLRRMQALGLAGAEDQPASPEEAP